MARPLLLVFLLSMLIALIDANIALEYRRIVPICTGAHLQGCRRCCVRLRLQGVHVPTTAEKCSGLSQEIGEPIVMMRVGHDWIDNHAHESLARSCVKTESSTTGRQRSQPSRRGLVVEAAGIIAVVGLCSALAVGIGVMLSIVF